MRQANCSIPLGSGSQIWGALPWAEIDYCTYVTLHDVTYGIKLVRQTICLSLFLPWYKTDAIFLRRLSPPRAPSSSHQQRNYSNRPPPTNPQSHAGQTSWLPS